MLERKDQDATKFQPGFTWRSALALLLAAAFILPVNTFLMLVSGATMATAAVYITVILFSELSYILGSPMSKQEIFIVFIMAGTAGGMPVYLGLVQRQYFVTSFISRAFIDPYTGRPLAEVIPNFWAPSYSSPAYLARSFLHQDWAFPLLIAIVQGGVLWILQEIALAIICSTIFIETERLPFPFADVNAQLVLTLTVRERRRMHIFALSALLSGFYGILVYGVPIITLGTLGSQFQIIPIPWIDLTAGYYGIEQVMPGAAFGIATDPITWATGFLLPLNLITYILIGSLGCWTFGNWLTLTVFKEYFPSWYAEWSYGMSLSLVWQRSTLRVWAFPQVGFLLALAAFSLIGGRKSLVRVFKALTPSASIKTALPSLWKALIMYIGATSCSVVVFHLLVPGFPFWISISTILMGFLLAIAGTRMRGETAQSIFLPPIWYGLVLASGYPKVDSFLVSPNIGGSSAPLWIEGIKTAYLTETKPMDFFKAYLLAVILYQVFSFIYVSFFWAIAPIPSSQYPWTTIQWPIWAITEGVWYSRQIASNPNLLAFSFLGMLAVGALGQGLTKFVGIPFSLTGLVTGTATLPPYAVTLLLGGLTGKYVLPRILGRETWETYRTVIVAGVAAGVGIVVGIIGAVTLLSKAVWILPY